MSLEELAMKPTAIAISDPTRDSGDPTRDSGDPTRDSGQAMSEYAILVMFVVANLVFFLPDFIEALQRYYESFYIILNLPIP